MCRSLWGVLKLCREAPCCTNLVGQGHGSGAATLKAHSQFGARSLQARASIHQCRGLFSKPSFEKLVGRLDEQIAKTRHRIIGARYSATQAFMLFLQRDPYKERPEGVLAADWARRCLVEHRAKFDQLSWEQKLEFQAEADVIDFQRRQLWQGELRSLLDRKSVALRQLAGDRSLMASRISSQRTGWVTKRFVVAQRLSIAFGLRRPWPACGRSSSSPPRRRAPR